MRVLFLGINYWPEETGIAPFNTGRCEFLASHGHHVTMLTGFPYYPQWRKPSTYRGRLFAREERNGVRVQRSYLYVPRTVTSVRRIMHEASFVASSCVRSFGLHRPDVLVTVSPPLALALSSVLLSRAWKVPFLFHVPDLQPDAAADLGMLREGRLLRALYAIERMAYSSAALVSTLTDSMRERILGKGIPDEKVVLLPDWADPTLFEVPFSGGESFRRRHALEGKFLVVHAGNMGVKQGLGVVLDAARRLRERPDIAFLLVGDGAARASLEQRASGLPNVRMLPLQPRDVFHDMLAAADVCLVTQQRSVADIVFPSKVITLLAAGRPVLASVNPGSEVSRAVVAARAGLSLPAEDPDALAAAVGTLADDRAQLAVMARAGREFARSTWERRRVLDDMESRLGEIIERRPVRRIVPAAARPVASAEPTAQP